MHQRLTYIECNQKSISCDETRTHETDAKKWKKITKISLHGNTSTTTYPTLTGLRSPLGDIGPPQKNGYTRPDPISKRSRVNLNWPGQATRSEFGSTGEDLDTRVKRFWATCTPGLELIPAPRHRTSHITWKVLKYFIRPDQGQHYVELNVTTTLSRSLQHCSSMTLQRDVTPVWNPIMGSVVRRKVTRHDGWPN